MTIDQQESGASSTESGAQSSNGAEKLAQETEGQTNAPEMVRVEDHKRVTDDMLKYKSGMRNSQAENADLKTQLQALKDAQLEKDQNFQSLAEQYKKRWEDSEIENKNLTDSFFTAKKADAVHAAAVKAGLRKEAEHDLVLLDLKDVAIERTDHGRVLVHGADDFVKGLQSQRPHWFGSKSVPKFNSGGAGGQGIAEPTELTPAYMVQLEMKDPVKYRELMPKFLEQRRKS